MSEPLRARRPGPRRRRASRIPKIEWPRRPPVPLAGQTWTPGDAGRPETPRRRLSRALAVLLAVCEVALLAWLVAGPVFQVRSVDVAGNQRLKSGEVVAAAGLARPGSVFTVDAATIRRKLTAMPWVREATVTTTLPDRVTLTIDEWQPVAIYLAGGTGQPLYLSDQAVILGTAPDAKTGLEIDGPAGPQPRVGSRPLDARLLTAMVNIQRGLPALIGQDVKSFAVDGCGGVTMTVQRGWRAQFGRVITPEEFAGLNQKLAALKSVASKEDLNNPNLDYINLENAQVPAVGLKTKPTPTPAATAQPTPAPSASPAPKIVPVVPCK